MKCKLSKKGHSSQTHILIGLVVLFILKYINNNHNFIDISSLVLLDYMVILFIVWCYSQLPDSDLPNSHINKLLTIVGLSVIGYAFINGEKTIGLMATAILLFTRLSSHRQMVHSVFIGFLFSLPLYYIKPIYAYVAFASFMAHIISEGQFSLISGTDWRIFKK